MSTDENSIKHSWLISLFCSAAEKLFCFFLTPTLFPIYFKLSELPRIIISRSFKHSAFYLMIQRQRPRLGANNLCDAYTRHLDKERTDPLLTFLCCGTQSGLHTQDFLSELFLVSKPFLLRGLSDSGLE